MEIGTGSGYNAALIAELVGEPALVTTVDIDPTLIAEAVPRLDRLGYGSITVSCGDGADGVPERAPFDRVVATVGCVDISPAWVDQLADGGRLLAPLEHGPMHPRVAVRQSETGLVGRFMGRSGFVRIQGSQASHRVWAGSGAVPVAVHYRVERLPASLAEAFDPPNSRVTTAIVRTVGLRHLPGHTRPARGVGAWPGPPQLAGHDPWATRWPSPAREAVSWRSASLAVGRSWVELGCPGHDRYAMTFTGKDARPVPPDTPDGPWVVDRIDYRQHIALVSENR